MNKNCLSQKILEDSFLFLVYILSKSKKSILAKYFFCHSGGFLSLETILPHRSIASTGQQFNIMDEFFESPIFRITNGCRFSYEFFSSSYSNRAILCSLCSLCSSSDNSIRSFSMMSSILSSSIDPTIARIFCFIS